jgi:hypothetical protein
MARFPLIPALDAGRRPYMSGSCQRQRRPNTASCDAAAPAATPTADDLFNSLAAEAREEDPDA